VVKNDNRSKAYNLIDWVKTLNKLEDIMDDEWVMNEERLRGEERLDRKRAAPDRREGDDSNRSKQRLDYSFEYDRSSSTKLDQRNNKIELIWLINKHIKFIRSNDLQKKIRPILTHSSDLNSYVWLHNNSLGVFGIVSDKLRPTVTALVDWHATLQEFISMAKEKGVEIIPTMSDDVVVYTNEGIVEPGIGEARHGTKAGPDEDMDASLTNADNDAKTILLDYYSKLQSNNIKTIFILKPVVDSDEGVITHRTYYFGKPLPNKPFNIKKWG